MRLSCGCGFVLGHDVPTVRSAVVAEAHRDRASGRPLPGRCLTGGWSLASLLPGHQAAVILENLTSLADSLFAYGSEGAHPDAHLRDIAWNRESAVLILGGAASLAQLIFARA